jgi:hypothetical protein
MIIRRSINKEEVKDMPKAVFPGQIHVVQTPQEAERAVAYLKKCSILGIDSETRPSFTKGQSHKVALLQISSEALFPFPPQSHRTHPSGYHVARNPRRNQSRPLPARRLHDAAQTCSV